MDTRDRSGVERSGGGYMREVKFRFWDKIEKKMSEPKELAHLPARYKKKRYIPIQFTDIKDKNGVDIYEGDIIGYKRERRSKNWRRVKTIEYSELFLDVGGWGMGYSVEDSYYKHYEIIGNKFENPELLESK